MRLDNTFLPATAFCHNLMRSGISCPDSAVCNIQQYLKLQNRGFLSTKKKERKNNYKYAKSYFIIFFKTRFKKKKKNQENEQHNKEN